MTPDFSDASSPYALHHIRSCTPMEEVFHSHPFFEFYFFLEGSTRLIVEDVDLHPRRGDGFLFPPGTMHRNMLLAPEKPYERFYFYVTPSFLQEISTQEWNLEDAALSLAGKARYHVHLMEADLQDLRDACDDLISTPGAAPPDRLIRRGKMIILLSRTLQAMSPSSPLPPSGHRSARLIRYLHAHLREDITLTDLEEVFHVNQFTLLRDFKAYTGISIHRYLTECRVQEARRCLLSGLSPAEAAADCGFSDYTTFYRAFRALEGCSPRAFMLRYRQ
ncbi:MAG: helix-turn-helix transcriptional regulator [Clostridia bacterium]|nr:helix-turn-helix transcriptional regulator [Clostridia bacterium]